MSPNQIAAVQASFAAVLPIASQAEIMVYDRLFVLDPSVRSLFAGDIAEQSEKPMEMIATVVQGLDKPETILPAVQALGVRHAGYGVSDADYQTVGTALLWTLEQVWTLEQGLGAGFTPEVAGAWTAAYTLLADTMKQAARAVNA